MNAETPLRTPEQNSPNPPSNEAEKKEASFKEKISQLPKVLNDLNNFSKKDSLETTENILAVKYVASLLNAANQRKIDLDQNAVISPAQALLYNLKNLKNSRRLIPGDNLSKELEIAITALENALNPNGSAKTIETPAQAPAQRFAEVKKPDLENYLDAKNTIQQLKPLNNITEQFLEKGAKWGVKTLAGKTAPAIFSPLAVAGVAEMGLDIGWRRVGKTDYEQSLIDRTFAKYYQEKGKGGWSSIKKNWDAFTHKEDIQPIYHDIIKTDKEYSQKFEEALKTVLQDTADQILRENPNKDLTKDHSLQQEFLARTQKLLDANPAMKERITQMRMLGNFSGDALRKAREEEKKYDLAKPRISAFNHNLRILFDEKGNLALKSPTDDGYDQLLRLVDSGKRSKEVDD